MISEAAEKYIKHEKVSVSDEIIGAAISAGSIPTRFASIGSMLPMIFANITIRSIDMQTVRAT